MTSTRRDFVLGVTGMAALGCTRRETAHDGNTSAAVNPAPPPNAPRPSAGGLPMRTLGRTGVNVSCIGLGGFHMGMPSSEKDSIDLVRRGIDGGITFLDNCWDYNDGKSEDRMGKALADGYRQRVFLMTKLDGRTRAAARGQLEQSLKRLRTDVIDLVQVHEVIRENDPERAFAEDGVVAELIEARKAGKLRYIGFTGHKDPKIHLSMLETARQHGFTFDTVQMPLNVLDAHYKSFEHEVLPILLERNIAVLGMKSMGSGHILKTGAVTPEECLRYALSLPTSVVICGMDNQQVLEQNLRVARDFKPLAADERQALLAKTKPFAADGKYETFKSSHEYDGTVRHPEWLEIAQM